MLVLAKVFIVWCIVIQVSELVLVLSITDFSSKTDTICSPGPQVTRAGRICILDIDVQGVKAVKAAGGLNPR